MRGEAQQHHALLAGDTPAVQRVRTVGKRIAAVATGDSRMSQLLRREINLHIVWHTKNTYPLLTPEVEPLA